MESSSNEIVLPKKKLRRFLPSWKNSALALLSGILLVLAFPDFEYSFLAWFAFVPLLWTLADDKTTQTNAFILGWIFGTTFFTGSCYWLTFAMINYGGIPTPFAYLMLLIVTSLVGLFPAIFALSLKILLKRFGIYAMFAAPFLWTATEFLRFQLTGNIWNALGYSQAFSGGVDAASVGGVFLVGFKTIYINVAWLLVLEIIRHYKSIEKWFWNDRNRGIVAIIFILGGISSTVFDFIGSKNSFESTKSPIANIIAIQPNVPMDGLKYEHWEQLRKRHVELAEIEIKKLKIENSKLKTIVIFPESPMNFTYAQDREFQQFLREFTQRDNVSVLFNSAEPSENGKGYTNSAVLVNERGDKIAQYDKIFLLPFGEFIPFKSWLPFVDLIPPVVGNFDAGKSYDLMPFGETKAGIVICFESAFPNLTNKFADEGADVLVEITNDGYLGNTPVLRQHLANAVFRAVETNRPLVRVTNVGITAFIDENGNVSDATKGYTEDTRTWQIKKSDGAKTFYVKYGDWFAWLCSIVSLALLFWSWTKGKRNET